MAVEAPGRLQKIDATGLPGEDIVGRGRRERVSEADVLRGEDIARKGRRKKASGEEALPKAGIAHPADPSGRKRISIGDCSGTSGSCEAGTPMATA